MTAWQPINTAPKDGTLILVLPAHGNARIAYWGEIMRYRGSTFPMEGAWCEANRHGHIPLSDPAIETSATHWMPIPPRPTP